MSNLLGEKKKKSYDFPKVCGWFAERADMILLLFDAHKLDISDEFKTVIESLKVCLCPSLLKKKKKKKKIEKKKEKKE